MTTFGYDLGYLQGGVQQLEHYLLSNDLYWPVGVKPPPGEPMYPQLTLGGMLLAQARLNTLTLESSQRTALDKVMIEFEAQQGHWRVAFGKKAAREFHARLALWRDFLEEVRLQPENHTDRYRFEVSRRVMLELLQPQATDIPAAEIQLLQALDKLLHAVFAPGRFIWEDEIQTAFPINIYWYLYGQLKASGKAER